jgi:tetratricopeptide (TPR) repeat protein
VRRPQAVDATRYTRGMTGSSWYEEACAHDRKGEEAEAIPKYERALALRLAAEDRRGALVGLGSSLRNVQRHADSIKVLEGAVAEFPKDPALPSFLALSLYSAGRGGEAVALLLEVVCAHAPVGQYARALKQYAVEVKT